MKFKNYFINNQKIILFLPYLIFILVFIVIPLIFILIFSFMTPPGATPDYNKNEIFQSPSFWIIFFRSFFVGIITALICLIIGLPYVYILTSTKNKALKYTFLSFIVSPLIIFTLVKILAIKGILTLIFDVPIDNLGYLIFGLVYLNLPFMIIPLFIILNNMPQNIIDASNDLGCTKIQTFLRVYIPYGLKSMCSGITVVFLLSIMSVAISNKLLDNSSSNQLIGNLIDDLANPSNPFDMQKASSVVLMTLIGATMVFFIINSIPYFYRKIKGGIND